MITITATELRKNLNKYLLLSNKEDVLITFYRKPYRMLKKPDKYDIFLSCCGIIKDFDYENLLNERDSNR